MTPLCFLRHSCTGYGGLYPYSSGSTAVGSGIYSTINILKCMIVTLLHLTFYLLKNHNLLFWEGRVQGEVTTAPRCSQVCAAPAMVWWQAIFCMWCLLSTPFEAINSLNPEAGRKWLHILISNLPLATLAEPKAEHTLFCFRCLLMSDLPLLLAGKLFIQATCTHKIEKEVMSVLPNHNSKGNMFR